MEIRRAKTARSWSTISRLVGIMEGSSLSRELERRGNLGQGYWVGGAVGRRRVVLGEGEAFRVGFLGGAGICIEV